jgi:hypothetical protein
MQQKRHLLLAAAIQEYSNKREKRKREGEKRKETTLLPLTANPKQLARGEMRLDDASSRQIQSLNRLSTITNRRANNPLLLCNHDLGESSGNGCECALWQTNTNQRAAEFEHLHARSISRVCGRKNQDGLSSQPISEGVYGGSEVRGIGVGDEVFGARGEAEVLFAGVVDGDDAVAHGARAHLCGNVAEAAACAEQDYPVAALG